MRARFVAAIVFAVWIVDLKESCGSPPRPIVIQNVTLIDGTRAAPEAA
jgi:hypothetical protein